MSDNLERRIKNLERMVKMLAARQHGGIEDYQDSTTSDPPTNAELDTIFGTPETDIASGGFIGTVAGSGGTTYLIVSAGDGWYYVALTVA